MFFWFRKPDDKSMLVMRADEALSLRPSPPSARGVRGLRRDRVASVAPEQRKHSEGGLDRPHGVATPRHSLAREQPPLRA